MDAEIKFGKIIQLIFFERFQQLLIKKSKNPHKINNSSLTLMINLGLNRYKLTFFKNLEPQCQIVRTVFISALSVHNQREHCLEMISFPTVKQFVETSQLPISQKDTTRSLNFLERINHKSLFCYLINIE